MNLHFSSKAYSIVKYGNDTKIANAKYDSLTENQKFRFKWLSENYVSNQDLMYAILGCQFEDVSIQFDLKADIHDAYIKFKSRRESITYSLQSELSKLDLLQDKSVGKIIFKYFTGEFSPELILLISSPEELEMLYNNKNLSWAKPKILRLIKYSDFFQASKFSQLLQTA